MSRRLLAACVSLGAAVSVMPGCVLESDPWVVGTIVTLESSPEMLVDWEFEVRTAFRLWEQVLGADCPFPYSIGPVGKPVRLVHPMDWQRGANEVGYWHEYRIEVRSEEPFSTAQILAHELGHAFGLDHSDSPQSVMNPVAAPGRYPKAEDGLAARTVLGCP